MIGGIGNFNRMLCFFLGMVGSGEVFLFFLFLLFLYFLPDYILDFYAGFVVSGSNLERSVLFFHESK